MKILAIESSCDETGACVVEKRDNQVKVLSNVIATSSQMHATTGGIIPENAAREQVKSIIPVIIEALLQSKANGKSENETQSTKWKKANKILKDDIDAIAITYGPGLIGSLLIGVETAKTLSYVMNKPIIPVNHLLAHIYANFVSNEKLNPKPYLLSPNPFPFIGLIVSGGHTDLLYFKSHTDFKWLGGTRDDAAGEAIDKIGRLLNLSYPAGPEMEKRANTLKLKANSSKLKASFTSPMIGSKDFDFSFSGLKAEVMRFVSSKKRRTIADVSELKVAKNKQKVFNDENKRLSLSEDGGPIHSLLQSSERHLYADSESFINQICYAVQKAIFDVLVKKTLDAAERYNCKTILLGGGVSANQELLKQFKLKAKSSKLQAEIFSPEKIYATDNAAMIGAYALIAGKTKNWENIKANPELYFG